MVQTDQFLPAKKAAKYFREVEGQFRAKWLVPSILKVLLAPWVQWGLVHPADSVHLMKDAHQRQSAYLVSYLPLRTNLSGRPRRSLQRARETVIAYITPSISPIPYHRVCRLSM